MLKKRPRACDAIRASCDGYCVWFGPMCMVDNAIEGSYAHNDIHDLMLGRCSIKCWADGMEPIRNVVGFWRVYDMETGQPVTDPFESPLEAMLEYLQTREEPE